MVQSTHSGRVTHICVSKQIIIGSDNGLSPGRRQATIWTNAGVLLIGPLGTNFSEILSEIDTFLFMKMHLKMLSAKWRAPCISLNVLTIRHNWAGYWLGNMRHAITYGSVGPDLWSHMTSLDHNELTHWGRDKIDAILQTTFSNAISWMKMFEFRLKFHWSLLLRVQLTIFQHWFR